MKVAFLLALQGSFYGAPSNDSAAPGLAPLPVQVRFVLNANRPWGWNDGALWAGRGLSGAMSGGARWRTGGLTVTLAPVAWFSTNGAFDTAAHTLPNRHPLAYPWNAGIDLPQRMGDAALARLTPGQSGIRFDWRRATVGLSTENLWWGPAQRYPILLSNSAEGFPHLDVGVRPASTPIGPVEGRVVWGRLAESRWFDTIPDNGDRLLAGMLLSWQPRWIAGLTVGFQRIFYQTWTDSLDASDFLSIVQPFLKSTLADTAGGNPDGNDARDQMLSLTWRWEVPGFVVYGEWARNDHNWNLRDLLTQPDHSQGWNVGLARTLPSGDGTVRISAEFLHLSRAPTFQIRAEPAFYAHHIVRQGYTHRGQPLGAGVGPSGDAQYVALDRAHAGGAWGVWFERVRWDVDAYYRLFGSQYGAVSAMDVTFELGGRYATTVAGLETVGDVSLIREINRHYRQYNDRWNAHAQIRLVWNP